MYLQSIATKVKAFKFQIETVFCTGLSIIITTVKYFRHTIQALATVALPLIAI
jgi:hypothetical protein